MRTVATLDTRRRRPLVEVIPRVVQTGSIFTGDIEWRDYERVRDGELKSDRLHPLGWDERFKRFHRFDKEVIPIDFSARFAFIDRFVE